MKASILILSKDGGLQFKKCLDKLFKQEFSGGYEVVVVDSGSKKETLDILAQYPVKLHKIPPVEFNYSRTRNYAANLAKGEFIVYLSQDAEPVDESWLYNLIRPLGVDDSVAAVFGRQLPAQEADPLNRFRIQWLYADKPRVKGRDTDFYFPRENFSFSNVNSVVRKEILIRFPFDESMPFGEDIYLANKIMDNGFRIAYAPKAAVFHTHNFLFWEIFRRYFDIAVTYKKIGVLDKINRIENEGFRFLGNELVHLAKNKQFLWIPCALIQEAFKYAGFRLGCLDGFLPLFLKKHIGYYWYKDVIIGKD